MGISRAERLVAAMTPEELRRLDGRIAGSRRESLKQLYHLVRKSVRRAESLDKPNLFRELFGRAYTRREDYLIRNELRLLTRKIYDILLEKEALRNVRARKNRADLFLLSAFLEHGLLRDFERMFRRCYDRAVEQLDFENAYRMGELYFQYLFRNREISLDVMQQALEVMTGNLDVLKRLYRTRLAVNQHNRVVCEENLIVMGRPAGQSTIAVDTDFTDTDTPFIRYYEEVSHAHRSTGEQRIRHAREALDQILKVARLFPDHAVLGYAILGSSFFVEHRYQDARRIFEEALTFAADHDREPPLDMVFNYMSTLMRLGMYEQVPALMDEYAVRIEESPRIRFRCECFRCFCHIFMGRWEEATAAIPPNISQRPESEYHYFRFIYLIIPAIRGDAENALRETRNFLVYFNRHKDSLMFPQEKEVALIYKNFYQTIYNITDREVIAGRLEHLTKRLQAFIREHPQYQDYLYISWLEKEIEKILTKTMKVSP